MYAIHVHVVFGKCHALQMLSTQQNIPFSSTLQRSKSFISVYQRQQQHHSERSLDLGPQSPGAAVFVSEVRRRLRVTRGRRLSSEEKLFEGKTKWLGSETLDSRSFSQFVKLAVIKIETVH